MLWSASLLTANLHRGAVILSTMVASVASSETLTRDWTWINHILSKSLLAFFLYLFWASWILALQVVSVSLGRNKEWVFLDDDGRRESVLKQRFSFPEDELCKPTSSSNRTLQYWNSTLKIYGLVWCTNGENVFEQCGFSAWPLTKTRPSKESVSLPITRIMPSGSQYTKNSFSEWFSIEIK